MVARNGCGSSSSEPCSWYAAWSRAARWANMVPRASTCSLTPNSNMSAAGAMVTSAMSASESIVLASSDRPASVAVWFTDPMTT